MARDCPNILGGGEKTPLPDPAIAVGWLSTNRSPSVLDAVAGKEALGFVEEVGNRLMLRPSYNVSLNCTHLRSIILLTLATESRIGCISPRNRTAGSWIRNGRQIYSTRPIEILSIQPFSRSLIRTLGKDTRGSWFHIDGVYFVVLYNRQP